MSKASVRAGANIAFVKYWGARDVEEGVPLNPSISMTLSGCVSHCTVELQEEQGSDEVYLADARGRLEPAPPDWAAPIRAQLGRVREWTGAEGAFRVATRNSFPAAAGLASSASGFAALTVAAVRATGHRASPEELSDLARRSGSGSAARSLFGGYVEWPAEMDCLEEGRAPARILTGPEHWDLRDVIAIVARGKKPVSSREGHLRVVRSPYFDARLRLLPERLSTVRNAVERRAFDLLWPVLEAEALDLHFLAMSSDPPIYYWSPATLSVLEAVRELRASGVEVGWTMDAGANVHAICPAASEPAVAERLGRVPGVLELLRDRVGEGPADAPHLF